MPFIKPVRKIDLESRGHFKETLFPWSYYLISSACWTKQVWNRLVLLKGNRAKEDASWSVNLRNLNTCYSPHALLGCFTNVYTKEWLFLLPIWASQDAAMLLRSLLMKSRKVGSWRVSHYCHTCRACSSRDCCRQLATKWQHSWSGFGDFQTWDFNKHEEKSVKNNKNKSTAVRLFVSPFLSTRPSCVVAPFPFKQRARH